MQISAAVAALLPVLTEQRRALHRIPEDGLREHQTQQYLLTALAALKPDDLRPCGGTGIKAVFRASAPTQPAIALRADMDALPITEATDCDFASQHPGFMHACGHDGHMAMLLGVAELIAAQRKALLRDVVLLFQPAEETQGGAQRLLADGAFVSPEVSEVYGLHLMPDLPLGTLASREGPLMAAVNGLTITLTGRRTHGATPHLGADAIAAAAHLYTLLQTAITRRLDPCQPALLTVGRLVAGEAHNVIAAEARLECTARTFSDAQYAALLEQVRADLQAVEIAFGVTASFTEGVYYPCVHNAAAAVARVQAAAGDAYQTVPPRLIAEDFSYYQQAAPGAFVFVGCGDAAHTAALHTDTFNFDERALLSGVQLLARLIPLAA